MRVTNKVKADVTAALKRCMGIAEAKYGRKFAMPTVIYRKRGTVGGTANDARYEIDLNPILLMENLDTFIDRTVVHEFAHLVDGIMNPHTRETRIVRTRRGLRRSKRDIHGATWKNIMRLFGAEPSRCHSYDVTNARVKNKAPRDHKWVCGCGGGEINLTAKKHARMMELAPAGVLRDGTFGGWYARGHTYRRCGKYSYVAAAPGARAANAAAPKPKAKPRAPRTGTKLDICRRWYSSSAVRSDMINLFVVKAGCTPAGAATYYAKIKKES